MIQNVISTEVEANSVKVKRKVYETGDHKNVANLEPFIATLETLGGIYNPTKELLKIDQLEALRADCSHTLLHLYTVKNIWTVRVTERTELFDKMGKYVNRILAAYKLQENNPERLKDFEALIRKLKGKRSIAIDEAAVKDGSKKIHSVSQYSVDSRIANLTKVLDMIMANPNYAPNEMDLKVEAIQAYLQELKTSNTRFIQADIELKQARMERDKKFYTSKECLVEVTRQVKIYVDTILDKTHPLNQKLRKMTFTMKYFKK